VVWSAEGCHLGPVLCGAPSRTRRRRAAPGGHHANGSVCLWHRCARKRHVRTRRDAQVPDRLGEGRQRLHRRLRGERMADRPHEREASQARANFPCTGNSTTVLGSNPTSPVSAVSLAGVHTSARITWFQANQVAVCPLVVPRFGPLTVDPSRASGGAGAAGTARGRWLGEWRRTRARRERRPPEVGEDRDDGDHLGHDGQDVDDHRTPLSRVEHRHQGDAVTRSRRTQRPDADRSGAIGKLQN
jgi:hypothetical protein